MAANIHPQEIRNYQGIPILLFISIPSSTQTRNVRSEGQGINHFMPRSVAATLLLLFALTVYLTKRPDILLRLSALRRSVRQIRRKLKLKGHYIYPHVGIPDTINTLRARLVSSNPALATRYQPETVSEIHSICFESLEISTENQLIEENIFTERPRTVGKGSPLTLCVRVNYQSALPRGVYLLTNLNQEDPPFEKILMSPTEEEDIFEATVIPRRAGDDFWLTAYVTPRHYDHDLTATWVGRDIRFSVVDRG